MGQPVRSREGIKSNGLSSALNNYSFIVYALLHCYHVDVMLPKLRLANKVSLGQLSGPLCLPIHLGLCSQKAHETTFFIQEPEACHDLRQLSIQNTLVHKVRFLLLGIANCSADPTNLSPTIKSNTPNSNPTLQQTQNPTIKSEADEVPCLTHPGGKCKRVQGNCDASGPPCVLFSRPLGSIMKCYVC